MTRARLIRETPISQLDLPDLKIRIDQLERFIKHLAESRAGLRDDPSTCGPHRKEVLASIRSKRKNAENALKTARRRFASLVEAP